MCSRSSLSISLVSFIKRVLTDLPVHSLQADKLDLHSSEPGGKLLQLLILKTQLDRQLVSLKVQSCRL